MPIIKQALQEYDLTPSEREQARQRHGISFLDEEGNFSPGRTQQNFADEVNINNIIRRYDKDGLLTHVANSVAQYGDFTEVNEYQESLNRVIAAQDAFDALPSNIRARFRNNPGEFFEFATNPANINEMVELGLAQTPEADPIVTAVNAVESAITANSSQSQGGTDGS